MRARSDKAHSDDVKQRSRLRRGANFGSTSDPSTFKQAVTEKKKESYLKQMYLSARNNTHR